MAKCVLCTKTDRPNEFAFIYKDSEYIIHPEFGGVLVRDDIHGKKHDEVTVFVESDIAPIVIELMYDCLEDEKSFKVII